MKIDTDDKILILFTGAGPLIGLASLLLPFSYFIGEPEFLVDIWVLWWAILVATYSLGILQAILAGFLAQYLLKKVRSFWLFQGLLTIFTVTISSMVSVWDQYDMMSDIITGPTWQLTLLFGAYPAFTATVVLGAIAWKKWRQ